VKSGSRVLFLEPFFDPFSPGLHSLMMTGITLFNVSQKALYGPAPCGEDGQTDHDEEYALKKWKKEAHDSQSDEEQPSIRTPIFLRSIHSIAALWP